MDTGPIKIIGCQGCGSVIAESFFALAGIPFEYEEVDYDRPGPERDRLLSLNPLGQVPTVILGTGSVLTETLAIANYVDALHPELGLIVREPDLRESFWRWIAFINSAIYPTFTYGDNPGKWVDNLEGANQLRETTDTWRQFLWLQAEKEAGSPYFLGSTFSALDVYIAVMVHWRPRKAWFKDACPKLHQIAERVRLFPKLTYLFKENFET